MTEPELPSLSIAPDALRLTGSILREAGRFESCCFWFGPRGSAGSGTVTAIVIPDQENRPGNYHVTAEAMLQVAAAVRDRGWRNLAQIHSHPGDDVHHSTYDDQMANSRRALSLVFPRYGYFTSAWRWRGWLWCLWPTEFPGTIGVHAFVRNRWAYLDPRERAAAIRIAFVGGPEIIDLRK